MYFGYLQVTNWFIVLSVQYINKWIVDIQTSLTSIAEASMIQKTIICTQKDFKSGKIIISNICEIYGLEGLRLVVWVWFVIILSRNLKHWSAIPIHIIEFMLSQQEAVKTFLVDKHLLDVLPFQNIIINISWLVTRLLKVGSYDKLVPCGEHPESAILHVCVEDFYA